VANVRKQTASAQTARFVAVIAVLALAGAALITVLVLNKPGAKAVAADDGLPAANAQPYVIGIPNAPVQVLEFADFECPTCGYFATVTEPDVRSRLINTGQIAIRYYDFLIPAHKNTWAASLAAACANDQGKFVEMHDRLFIGQPEWNTQATSTPKVAFTKYAAAIGLDVAKWDACFEKRDHIETIKGNMAEGLRRGVNGTPTFFIGGKSISGSPPYDAFKRLVDEALPAATNGK
jgi:protein-disulfide isomerase